MEPIHRRSILKKRYGITPEDYDRMLAEQGGRCAVCRTNKPRNGRGDKVFDVDHDHATGKVRGLLCRKCNVTTGVLEKNRQLIAKIETYLKG